MQLPALQNFILQTFPVLSRDRSCPFDIIFFMSLSGIRKSLFVIYWRENVVCKTIYDQILSYFLMKDKRISLITESCERKPSFHLSSKHSLLIGKRWKICPLILRLGACNCFVDFSAYWVTRRHFRCMCYRSPSHKIFSSRYFSIAIHETCVFQCAILPEFIKTL